MKRICDAGAKKLGLKVSEAPFFDTVKISVKDAQHLCNKAVEAGVNLRLLDDLTVTISLDETTTLEDVDQLLFVLNANAKPDFSAESLISSVKSFGTCICSYTILCKCVQTSCC